MSARASSVTVIGAGVIGTACARTLQRDGHHVRLVDPLPPGHACSWGNAGVFATDSVVPLATPATLAAVPGMLLRRDAPLSLRWRYLPRLLPWLVRFIGNARPARVEANARALAALCRAADAATRELVSGSEAAALIRETGWLTVYETRAGLAGGRREAAERQRRGVACDVLSGDEVRRLLPEAADHVVGGLHSPDCSMCRDPARFVECLAADFAADGGIVEQDRVVSLAPTRAGMKVGTAAAGHDADHVVVATGIATPALAQQLGDRFPLDTERGYHVMIPHAGIEPAMPVMAGEHKFVTTPMAGGLRLAGLSELGGPWLPPDPRRYRTLIDHARRLFPDLAVAEWREWMGLRSTLPDSLPAIGRSPSQPRVSYAFGHQHLGLTLAGLTGRLAADDLAGREPPIDTAPVRPGRYRRYSAATG